MQNKISASELATVPELLAKGMECFVEAGRIVAETLSEHPDAMERVCELTGLPQRIIETLERVGRKQLHPMLLDGLTIGRRKLAACTYSVQERYINEPLTVVVRTAANERDLLKVRLDDLTAEQAKQVFDRGTVRDASAQTAWLLSRSRTPDESASMPYTTSKTGVTFKKGCKLKWKEVAALLAQGA